MNTPKLAIIVPCYNEEAILERTNQRIISFLQEATDSGIIAHDSFVCFVDDGSQDNTWNLIKRFLAGHHRISGLKLSKNFGHQNALLAGLMRVREICDCTISLDADLQQDITAIPQFIAEYQKGVDIVFGIRYDRKADTFLKRSTAELFYASMSLMGVTIIRNHADYRLMSKKALSALSLYGEENLFLRGLIPQMGFRTSSVYFDVTEREAGVSKYTFRKMLSLAIRGITSFSVVPLRLIAIIGLSFTLTSFFMVIYVLISKILFESIVPGWASIVLPIYFLGGLQLFALGVIGEYIGRIYIETKRRPRFLVEEDLVS